MPTPMPAQDESASVPTASVEPDVARAGRLVTHLDAGRARSDGVRETGVGHRGDLFVTGHVANDMCRRRSSALDSRALVDEPSRGITARIRPPPASMSVFTPNR
jgi:hypothetical protein